MFLKTILKIPRAVASLFKSGYYACCGLRYAINHERSMRIHVAILVLVFQFGVLYGLDRWGYMVLLLTHGVVIAAEMTNTAIEVLVDLETHGFNTVAGIAKDVAAGTVLITTVAGAGVIFFLFSNTAQLAQAMQRIVQTPWMLVVLVTQFALGILFIFQWSQRGRIRLPFMRKRYKK